MRGCNKCGARNESTDKICTMCGAKINRKPNKFLVVITVLLLLTVVWVGFAFLIGNVMNWIQTIPF